MEAIRRGPEPCRPPAEGASMGAGCDRRRDIGSGDYRRDGRRLVNV